MRNTLALSTALLLAIVAGSISQAQETEGIPKKVLKELDFMVGTWQSDMFENGEKVGTSRGERKWSSGKYCLHFSATLDLHGSKFDASGISGWSRKGRAVIERWYGSNGASLTVRYPLAKMKGDVWEGTHHLVQADGSERKGSCTLEKGDGQWIYRVEWDEDGKVMKSKNITKRVTN